MDSGIIALCNYVKRKYVIWWTLPACAVASAHRRFTYLRFIVISYPKLKMTHLQSYKAGELIKIDKKAFNRSYKQMEKSIKMGRLRHKRRILIVSRC